MEHRPDVTTSTMNAAAYDRIAPLYAQRNAAMPEELAAIASQFLALVGPEAALLDVGRGTGRDMAWMEARGVVVTGIDLSTGMLAEARRQVRGLLLQMDMRHLTFPDGRFDGIWCTASLLHLLKLDAPDALREMRRVLVDGGILFLGLQEGTGEGWEVGPYDVPVERFFARYRVAEVEEMLAQTGFVTLEYGSTDAGNRRWLQFLAEKLGEGGK